MTTAPSRDVPQVDTGAANGARPATTGDARVRLVVVLVAAAYAVVVGTLALLRYASFASDFDHGIFSQYVWLLGHLHEPFNTINLRTLLGDHVEPGIALLAPLGTLGIGTPGILVVQTLALAATAPLLYLLAREHGAQGWVAALPALLWCASPVVLRPALHDFHPETLVPVLLVGGCLALARDRLVWFGITGVLACAMKEDVGLTYAALGLVLLWSGRRRLGALVAILGAAWSVVAVYVVLPAFGNAAEQEFGPRFAGDRGDSVADVVRYSVLHPLTAADRALSPQDVGVLAMLVLTTGGLCLLAPRWLLVAVPGAALNLLSAYDLQHTIAYHYWIVPTAAVAVAGAVGAGRVGAPATWLRAGAGVGVLLVVLSLQWGNAITEQIRFEWDRRADRQAVLDRIPDGASVAAPMQALSHLAERTRLYVVPEPLLAVRVGTEWTAADRERATEELDYIVFDPRLKLWGAPTAEQVERESAVAVPSRSMPATGSRSTGARTRLSAREPDRDRPDRRTDRLRARPWQEHPAARGPPAARVRDRDGPSERRVPAHRRLHRQRDDRQGRPLVRR